MNSRDLQQRWDDVCTHIKGFDDIDSAMINAVFSRLRPKSMSTGLLVLTTDSSFIKNWVGCHYLEIIKASLQTLYGAPFSVRIEVVKEELPDDASEP